MWPFSKRRMVKPGVYHYTGTGDLEGKRIHLRVDNPEKGILIMDASRMLILNRTGVEFSHLILQGYDDRKIIKELKKYYRVKRSILETDLKDFKEEFYSLLDSTEIVSNMEEDLSSLFEGQKAPYRMDLAITYKCNNDCYHCYNERRDSKELDTKQWKTVLDKCWNVGIPHIIFTGGEPTLREDLLSLIEHAENLGQITGMNTNGRKLKEKKFLKKLMDAGLDHVQITVESLNPEIHDNITRSKGSHKDTMKGLKNCIDSGIYLVTNTTIMEENKDDVLETVKALKEMGVEHIAVNSLIRSGKGKDAKGIELKELKAILEEGRKMGLEEDFEFRWYSPTPYCKLNPMEMGLGTKQCSACRLNMAVEPDGAVIPCQSYYKPVGNILKDEWEEIFDHKLCKKIRDRKGLPGECRDCDLLNVCGGGCPLSWDSEDYICRNVLSS